MCIRDSFLGGLNEIGKNFTLYECEGDMLIVDCGMSFPDDDMLGVDLVLPDFTFVERNADKIRGIVLTHGHEDHIGALPYLLKSCLLYTSCSTAHCRGRPFQWAMRGISGFTWSAGKFKNNSKKRKDFCIGRKMQGPFFV